LLTAALSAFAFGVAAPPAAAKAPCWRQVINDWVDNNRVKTTYPLHCYPDAIAHVQEDLRAYSSIVDDITSARQQAARTSRVPSSTNLPRSTSKANKPKSGLFTAAFDKLGTRNVNSVPLPLLILAALSLLLMAAGAAGLVSRHMRARKVPG
jgi:hypothetical protein